MPRRPFYIVAHRANDPEDVGAALAAGANAIEADLRGDFVDHDGEFPWSTRLSTWLDAVASAAANQSFALLYLDIKTPEKLPQIVANVTAKVPATLPTLFSVAKLSSAPHLAAIVPTLAPNQGICIDEDGDATAAAKFFKATGLKRCWYGNGIFLFGPPHLLPGIEASIRAGVAIRDTVDGGIDGVVHWTLEKEASLRMFIDIGVDAILVNADDLGTLRAIVESSPKVRAAARNDSPWARS